MGKTTMTPDFRGLIIALRAGYVLILLAFFALQMILLLRAKKWKTKFMPFLVWILVAAVLAVFAVRSYRYSGYGYFDTGRMLAALALMAAIRGFIGIAAAWALWYLGVLIKRIINAGKGKDGGNIYE